MTTETLNLKKRGHILSAQKMQEIEAARQDEIRIWAHNHKLGTKPATFPEVSKASPASRKGSMRRKKKTLAMN